MENISGLLPLKTRSTCQTELHRATNRTQSPQNFNTGFYMPKRPMVKGIAKWSVTARYSPCSHYMLEWIFHSLSHPSRSSLKVNLIQQVHLRMTRSWIKFHLGLSPFTICRASGGSFTCHSRFYTFIPVISIQGGSINIKNVIFFKWPQFQLIQNLQTLKRHISGAQHNMTDRSSNLINNQQAPEN